MLAVVCEQSLLKGQQTVSKHFQIPAGIAVGLADILSF